MSLIRTLKNKRANLPALWGWAAMLWPPQHIWWDGRGADRCSPRWAVPGRLKPWHSTEWQKDPQTQLQPNSLSEGTATEMGHEEKAKKVEALSWFQTRQSNVPCCTMEGSKPPVAALHCREGTGDTEISWKVRISGYHQEIKTNLIDLRIQ